MGRAAFSSPSSWAASVTEDLDDLRVEQTHALAQCGLDRQSAPPSRRRRRRPPPRVHDACGDVDLRRPSGPAARRRPSTTRRPGTASRCVDVGQAEAASRWRGRPRSWRCRTACRSRGLARPPSSMETWTPRPGAAREVSDAAPRISRGFATLIFATAAVTRMSSPHTDGRLVGHRDAADVHQQRRRRSSRGRRLRAGPSAGREPSASTQPAWPPAAAVRTRGRRPSTGPPSGPPAVPARA